jgi:hypothetical protein
VGEISNSSRGSKVPSGRRGNPPTEAILQTAATRHALQSSQTASGNSSSSNTTSGAAQLSF